MLRRILELLNFAIAVIYFIFLVSIPVQFWNNCFPPGSGPEVQIVIEPDKNAMEIARSFRIQGIVDDPYELTRWMAHFGIDRKLIPGTYTLRKGTPWELARQLLVSEPSYFKFTIIPGKELSDLERIFGGSVSASEIHMAIMNNDNYPEELHPLLPETLDGRITFLLPETYILPAEDPEYIIRQASSMWWDKVGTLLKPSDNSSNTLLKLCIIASLIEKEARIDKERPVISGVIYNRLDRGMPLQIDATVIYAWKQTGTVLNRVLFKDLEIDSPFNTYKHKGLPPDPICIPSFSSWKASLSPEKNNYLYYVAGKDGQHIFSTTYNKHLNAIKQIKKGK